jgi:hypothetical protein
VRFSPFKKDRRIGPGGSLAPGSYAAPRTDSALAPSGFAVVGRYALPNPAPAIYVFDIHPPAKFGTLVGTVTPNFAQAGGGVEVMFTKGLPPGCVVMPARSIPEY